MTYYDSISEAIETAAAAAGENNVIRHGASARYFLVSIIISPSFYDLII